MLRMGLLCGLLAVLLGAAWGDVFSDLNAAAGRGDLAAVRALVEADPKLPAQRDETHFYNPLASAARGGYPDIVSYLLDHGALIEQPGMVDEHYLRPLHHAVQVGQAAVVEVLLQHGASVREFSQEGDPLWMAIFGARPAIAALLLQHGADPNRHFPDYIPGQYPYVNQTPLGYARLNRVSPALLQVLINGGARSSATYFYTDEPAPYMAAGKVGMVPLQALAAWFGGRVTEEGTALSLVLRTRAVMMTMGSRDARYGWRGRFHPATLPAAPERRNGVIYVPLRAFIDGLDLATDWSDCWLQATLHHPTTGEALIVALADPDSPDPRAVRQASRRGPQTLVDVNTYWGQEMYRLNRGALGEYVYGHVRKPLPPVKCYSPTRYIGGGQYSTTNNRELFPVMIVRPVVGITGHWNAMPRPVQTLDTADPRFQAIVRAKLDKHDMKTYPVKIDQAYRVDLNGDGRQTILLSGVYNTEFGDYQKPRRHYSFAGMWAETPEGLKQLVCYEQYIPEVTDIYGDYSIGGIFDANGDGKMEVLLNDDSSWTARTLYARTADGVKMVITQSWGE